MGKTALIALLAAFVLLAACSQIGKGGSYPIVTKKEVLDPDEARAEALFEKNSLSIGDLQIYRVEKDEINYTHIWLEQYVNGIRILGGEVIYHFKPDGSYSSMSGSIVKGITGSSLPEILESDAREIAKPEIEKLAGVRGEKFNSALEAELVYFQKVNEAKAEGYPYIVTNVEHRLAWYFKPAEEYPLAVGDAIDGSILHSDSGIRYAGGTA